jgi:hypothetical protein
MVFLEVTKGMYGLPQAGLLANKLLEKRLNKHGYYQSKLVPGLWKHESCPIMFTLIVNDFGVKYVGANTPNIYYQSSNNTTNAKLIGRANDTSAFISCGTVANARCISTCQDTYRKTEAIPAHPAQETKSTFHLIRQKYR